MIYRAGIGGDRIHDAGLESTKAGTDSHFEVDVALLVFQRLRVGLGGVNIVKPDSQCETMSPDRRSRVTGLYDAGRKCAAAGRHP
jgi:hypothetical protein